MFKIEIIYNSAVYNRELENGHFSDLYYLIFWKDYLEEKNT